MLVSQLSSGNDWAASVTGDNQSIIIFSERTAFAETDVYASERPSSRLRGRRLCSSRELSIPGYDNHDTTGSISDDGLRIYFTRALCTRAPAISTSPSERPEHRAWSTPVAITSLNTSANEYGIDVTGDELFVVFGSARDGGNGQYYCASRTSISDPWSNIKPIATLASFRAPSQHLSSDGLTLYMTSSSNSVMGVDDVWVLGRPNRSRRLRTGR